MKPQFYISVEIPVKSYVKKYLCVRYGTEHKLSKTTLLGILIFQLLDSKVEKQPVSAKDFDSRYVIQISEFYFNIKGFRIPMAKRKFLAICLEKLFYEDLYMFIDKSIRNYNVSAMKALKIFLEEYKISENDAKLESIYRQYQRYSSENITEKKIKCA